MMWTTPSRWLMILGCLLLPTMAHAQQAPAPRWAILSSKTIEDLGIPDLVQVQLSKRDDLSLVERQDIAKLTQELVLDAALGGKESGKRLELGKMLKADVLVFLTEAPPAPKVTERSLRLVVAETKWGARLRLEHFPLKGAKHDELIRSIAEALADVRKQYDKGLQRVFGVSPLISRNLTHDFDHLQAGLAHVLMSRLSTVPGTAVLELEEAQHLRKELELKGDTIKDRPVTLFLEGEFEVRGGANRAGDAGIALTLHLKDADKIVKTLKATSMPLTAVARYLSEDAAKVVLEAAAAGNLKSPPLDQQFALLVKRAEAFARLGMWEHAVGLREAALLVDPAHMDQRYRVFQDYHRLLHLPIATDIPAEKHKMDNPAYRALVIERLGAWKTCYEHLATMILSGKLDLEQATKRSDNMFQYLPVYLFYGVPKEMEATRQDFLRELYPRIGKIKSSSPHASTQQNQWEAWRDMCMMAVRRWDGTQPRKADLDLLADLLINVIPDKEPISSAVHFFLRQRPDLERFSGKKKGEKGSKGSTVDASGRFTEEEYLDFLDRLKKSDRKTAQFYGRYGWVYYHWLKPRQDGKRPSEETLVQAASLLKDCPRQNDYVYVAVRDLHFYIDQEVNPQKYKTKESPPVPAFKYPDKTTGDLTYHPIDMKVKKLDGKIIPFKEGSWQAYHGWGSLYNFTPCEDGLDVFWNNGALAFLREKGMMNEVFVDAKPIFDDVKWDGLHVWIATRRDGLWVVGRSGKIVTKIGDKQGLPPREHGFMLLPLSQGKIFAVGSLGDRGRTWCAIVTLEDNAGAAKVVHQCTRVWTSEDEGKDEAFARDPAVSFRPAWVHLYQRGPGKDPLILVGRNSTLEVQRRPLVINARTLEVDVADFQTYFADRCQSDAYFSKNGILWEAGSFQTYILQPRAEKPKQYARANNGSTHPRFLPYQGKLYLSGGVWWELDPDDLSERQLVPFRLPTKLESIRNYGVSTHYGLIAWEGSSNWGDGAFFQITVAPPRKDAPPKKDTPP